MATSSTPSDVQGRDTVLPVTPPSSTVDLQLRPYDPSHRLRSSDADRLAEPVAWTATAERRFSYFAPRVWNALPSHVMSADSLDSSKARLKSHLFDIV